MNVLINSLQYKMSGRLRPYTVKWSFAPLVLSMRVFGLVWPRADAGTSSRWRVVGIGHVLLVSTLVTMHSWRFVMVYEDSAFGPKLMLRVRVLI